MTAPEIGRGRFTGPAPSPRTPWPNGVGADAGRRQATEFEAETSASPPSAGSPPPGSLRARIVGIALAELARWDAGRRRETDPTMTPVLQEYYRTGVGIQIGVSDLRSASWHAKNAWSAVFVSYVMRRAGAVGFRFSAAHREYVAAAKQNARRGDTGNPFWAFPINRARPAPGDLVCADRVTGGACNGATFDNIDDGRWWATHCDIVTNVEDARRQITVVGGNVSNSVKAKTLRIDANGFLVPGQDGCGHFAVVKVLDAGSPTPAAAGLRAAADILPEVWDRTLSQGMSGEDVRQLQIRVSGYPGYDAVLVIDGAFGSATRSAVVRFQQAYGLTDDGIAGPQTYDKIDALEDHDGTPINFSYAELNHCNSDWSGGAVSASTAKFNALVNMWKLQAMRHALGDAPLYVSSGFRSYSCNSAVGGSSTSRHLYGDAVDLTGSHSLCTLAKQSRYHGWREILGPGYKGHDDHVHLAHKSTKTWSASSCGI
jgi:zinc D-Ala-D-Ala carboxypeptidase